MSVKSESENPENQDDNEISLLDLAAVIWKHRRLVIGITSAVIIGILVFVVGSIALPVDKSYLPNVYTPKAVMIIQSSNASNSMSAALSASGLASLAGLAGVSSTGNTNGNLAEILAINNTTLDSLNGKFDFSRRIKAKKNHTILASDIRGYIKKNLSAKFDLKTNLFSVSFTDIDPILAKNVVDETVRILEARFASLSGDKLLIQKNLLEKKLSDVNNSVQELEVKIKVFQNKYGVMQVEALATEQITILARLRSELILKEMEISNYEKISRVNDPIMIQLKNERDNFLAKIKEIETGTGTGSRVMPSQKELPAIAFEYAKIQRDLLVQTELFKILTQQYELAKLNAAGQEPVFQILEMAEVPDKKSGPSRGMICMVSTMAGFFLSLFLAFAVESVEKMKNNPETVARFKTLSSKKGTQR